jgi:hypothetical protein
VSFRRGRAVSTTYQGDSRSGALDARG